MRSVFLLLALTCVGLALAGANPTNEFPSQLERKEPTAVSLPTCALCKTVVKEVNIFLKDNRTEEAIENALTQVCHLFSGDTQEQCLEMIRAYTKEIVKVLADETDPELVCMILSFCSYDDIEHPEYQSKRRPCSRALLPEEEKEKEKQREEEAADEFAEAADEFAEAADEFEEAPTFGDFISMLDPTIKKDSMRTCIECKLFIKYLQDTFESAKNRDTLKKWLMDNMCHNLNDPDVRDSCTKMVDRYSDEFFKAIAEQLDPKLVCFDLKACHKKNKSMLDMLPFLDPEIEATFRRPALNVQDLFIHENLKEDSKEDVDKIDTSICESCVSIVTKLDDYLSTHSIDQDVNELIDNVCNRIPMDNLRDTCAMMVKSLGQELVEKLHTMDNPKQFCQDVLSLC